MTGIRITKINGKALPPLPKGEVRGWEKCPECGWTGFFSYVPYSFGGRFRVLGCGHPTAKGLPISEADAVSAIHDYAAKAQR